MRSFCGWITGDGTFYECGFHEHIETAHTIPQEKKRQQAMLKLHDSSDPVVFYEQDCRLNKITKHQRETLFDLCAENGYNFDEVTWAIDRWLP